MVRERKRVRQNKGGGLVQGWWRVARIGGGFVLYSPTDKLANKCTITSTVHPLPKHR